MTFSVPIYRQNVSQYQWPLHTVDQMTCERRGGPSRQDLRDGTGDVAGTQKHAPQKSSSSGKHSFAEADKSDIIGSEPGSSGERSGLAEA